MALHSELDLHLRKVAGASGYSVSGTVATLTGSLDHRRLEELINIASQISHTVTVNGGAVKVQPK